MKQVHIFITGSVQGVGFRFFIKSHARQFSIVGWAANTEDGKVEAVLQGSEENIIDLIEKCKKGPFLAEVKNIDVKWEDVVERYGDFQLVRD